MLRGMCSKYGKKWYEIANNRGLFEQFALPEPFLQEKVIEIDKKTVEEPLS